MNNYKQLLIIAIALLICSSCKHSVISGDHIPPKTMQKILLDINIAETYSLLKKDSLHRPGSKNIDSLSAYYKEIFDHYHITQAEFKESMDWYKNNPDQLDSIYNNNNQIIAKWQAKDAPALSKPDSAKLKTEISIKAASPAKRDSLIKQPSITKQDTSLHKKPAVHKKKLHHHTAAVTPAQ